MSKMENVVPVLVAVFAAIVIVVMIIIRIKFRDRFEIKSLDIVIVMIPIAIWLVLSGRVKVFEIAGFKIESAFVKASEAEIDHYDVKLPVESIRVGMKEGIGQIPQLIEAKTEALSFRLGYDGYYGPAIEKYILYLSEQPFFRYIIIIQNDGKFFGMADAREIYSTWSAVEELRNDPELRHSTDYKAGYSSEQLAGWLIGSNTKALADNLPGYIPAENAIKEDTDKQTALAQMEKLDVEVLPVVHADGTFAGVVERARLVSSLIIDVADKMK